MPANGQPSSTVTMRLVFFDRSGDGIGVERPQAAQIDDFRRNPRFLAFLGGLQRQFDHARKRGDRHVVAGPRDARPADRHEIFGIVGHGKALAVNQLVFEKDDRVRVADRRFQQALVIGAGEGRYNFEPGAMRIPARIALRMLGRDAGGDAVWAAKDDRAAHLTA